ncbi:MAG: MerR family transcriptional regulator [Brevundimonas sp.]|nr:MAG: MerR family transcriptional regulator [Brevundimonas sp.]
MGSSGLHAVVSISRLSAMTGVTPRALRHYEEVGLIQPHRAAHGVRLFTPDQCERASLIALLRRCDVALEDIRDVLEPSPQRTARLRDVLQRKADELSDKLAGVNAVLDQSFPAPRRDAA